MKKVPYGSVGSFDDLVSQGYFYIDRTNYLEKLEGMSEKHLFFLRPRRFGKSLFVSILQHYYGLEHADKFDRLFGDFYAGKHPTALKNSYLILKFNFSGINTTTNEISYRGFLNSVRYSVEDFLTTYKAFFNSEHLKTLINIASPEDIMKQLWNWVKSEGKGKKIYVLIDEYDQFTNELIAYRFEEFKKIVSINGWVRKFYETLKIGADKGIIDRTFITGVTPITFDSLTSGFSNATDVSTDLELSGMMGFTDEEVRGLLQNLGLKEEKLEQAMQDLKQWYDGYVFSEDAKTAIYNSEMVLYFIKEFVKRNDYPQNLLAPSVATDYHKIQSMFRIAHKEKENLVTLKKILTDDEVTSFLVQKFNFADCNVLL
ncbi:MAG: AAA family ATPase [Chitinophagales bacterium]